MISTYKKRIRVKLSRAFNADALLLQTPNNSGIWDNVEFVTDNNCPDADFWVVSDDLPEPISTTCPPSHLLLITGEPPSIKSYAPAFLAQFSRILTCHEIDHPGLIHKNPPIPWRYGLAGKSCHLSSNDSFVENYDTLTSMFSYNQKERLISAICSTKTMCDGHIKRSEFISFLERAEIPELDIFGRGRKNEVLCKRDAIAPYKYHIALENSSFPNYWTEKLADAFLGGTHPFYWGCPNITDYFPRGSFTWIDIEHPEEALRTIYATIEKNTFDNSIELISEARERVLNKYNLFSVITSLIKDTRRFEPSPPTKITLQPENRFTLQGNLRRFWTFLKMQAGSC